MYRYTATCDVYYGYNGVFDAISSGATCNVDFLFSTDYADFHGFFYVFFTRKTRKFSQTMATSRVIASRRALAAPFGMLCVLTQISPWWETHYTSIIHRYYFLLDNQFVISHRTHETYSLRNDKRKRIFCLQVHIGEGHSDGA